MDSNFSIEENKPVVFVGLVCLDIVNVLANYPIEDLGTTCIDCAWRRGGNASNSATVFSLLGGKTCFYGTLAESDEMVFLLPDFNKYNISYERCPKIEGSSCPISIVILSKSSGTRTVLHTNKKLRELALTDLKTNWDLEGDSVGWMHFEGRDNAFNISQMITFVMQFNEQCGNNDTSIAKVNPIMISLEAEKLRFASGMDQYNLWQLPDVLFVSKDFAKSQGYQNMNDAAQGYFQKVKKGSVVICAWGEHGAAAMSEDEGLVTSPAFPPSEVLDTCGAGDTFNASVIRALSTGKSLHEAITFGCKVAGFKCGSLGFDGIKNLLQ